jgi:hypothetical protein
MYICVDCKREIIEIIFRFYKYEREISSKIIVRSYTEFKFRRN